MTQIALLVRDDLALSAAANDVLTLNSTVPSSVGATAKNGDITLTGTMRPHRAGRGGTASRRAHRRPLVGRCLAVRRDVR